MDIGQLVDGPGEKEWDNKWEGVVNYFAHNIEAGNLKDNLDKNCKTPDVAIKLDENVTLECEDSSLSLNKSCGYATGGRRRIKDGCGHGDDYTLSPRNEGCAEARRVVQN